MKYGKVREVIRLLIEDVGHAVALRGSHRQFRHRTKPGRVTARGHPGEDMPRGALASILRHAGQRGGPR
jgi:predicted RNA binding protein YcfA (HicA-like mRNA interferase family)